MVAGIVKAPNDSFRIKTEKYFAAGLRNMGYNTVTSFDEFGPTGLQNLSEEETYIRLCEKGIDAVIVVALIDLSKQERIKQKKTYGFSGNYYYDRIWNYKNITADFSDENNKSATGYFWESILFNLRTLEAECTVQTKPFNTISATGFSNDFVTRILKQMRKEGILKVHKVSTPKPF